jgi:hypothetical protein
MLFNLDRNIKHSILEEYKREALLHQQRKERERQQKIKEEREYLEEKKRKDLISSQILKEEEMRKKNKQMKEYQEMLSNIQYKNYLKNEVQIKNWGQTRNLTIPYKDKNTIKSNFRKDPNNNFTVDYYSLSPAQKEKMFIRKSDNMKKYLTDEQNVDEIMNFLKGEKQYRQKYYKELLNTQFQAAQKKIKDKYGTNDILIIENKKRSHLVDDNLLKSDKKYYFGKSNLLHNPIINPENDIAYNRYINLRINKSNILQNTIQNNIYNNNNNKKGNSLEIKTDEFSNNQRVNNEYNEYSNYVRNSNKKLRGQLCQSEPNLFANIENKTSINEMNKNNKKKLIPNSYSSFSNDNIFNYKNNLYTNNNIYNKKYDNSSNIKIIEGDNFEYKPTVQQSSRSILSQAAKSNFLYSI